MNKKELNQLIKALKAVNEPKTQTKASNDALNWWKKKYGFQVQEKGLKVKCSNGKTYPAVKGVTKDNVELTLVAIRGGNVYAKPF